LKFCGGYQDAEDAEGSEELAPRFYDFSALAGYEFNPYVISVRDDFQVKGLSEEQGVALAARENLSSQYFQDLMAACASNEDSDDFSDLEKALCEDEFGPIVETFANDEEALKESFVSAWTYMMTADRFTSNVDMYCTGVDTPTVAGAAEAEPKDDDTSASATATKAMASILAAAFAVI
jgi:hypothetical protein